MSTVQSYNYIEPRKFDTFDFLTIIHHCLQRFFFLKLTYRKKRPFLKSKNIHGCFSKEWLNSPTCKEKCRDDFQFKSLAYFTNFSRLKRFDRLGDEKNISSPKNQAYSKVSGISRALSRMRSLVFSLPFAFLVVIGISSAQKIKVFLILNCFSSSTPISLRDRVNHSPFVIIIVRWSRNHYYHRQVISLVSLVLSH